MRMPWRKTFLLGFGFFGISLVWPLYDSYVPIFLSTFGLSNRLIGFLMTADNWVNLFVQPAVGVLSDRTRTRIGRRFPFILIGAPLAAVGIILIPLGATHSLPALVGAMLLMTISMALFRTPAVALLGDVFPPELRSRANGVINFMGLLAGIIAFLAGGMLYKIRPAYPFWAAAVAMLFMLGLLMVIVREPTSVVENGAGDNEGQGPGLRATLYGLIRNPDRSALLILCALLAWSIGFTAIQAFFTLYGKHELGLDEGTASQLLSFFPLAGLLFAIPGGYLGTYLGRRRTMLLCLAVLTLVLITFAFVSPTARAGLGSFTLLSPDTWFATPIQRLLILLLMTAGASMTVMTVNILPMLFETAPAGQAGSYTGLYYLFGSLASIIGPPLGGLMVDLMGGSYRTIFIVAPVFVAAGFCLMWLVRGGEVGRPATEVRTPEKHGGTSLLPQDSRVE